MARLLMKRFSPGATIGYMVACLLDSQERSVASYDAIIYCCSRCLFFRIAKLSIIDNHYRLAETSFL